MKGIVFTEFVEMVEGRFGLDVLDVVLDPEGLSTGGAYAATGTYDHAEMVTLVSRLATETGASIPDLLRAFGEHVFERFYVRFPMFFEKPRTAFEFLATINDTIHVAVRKLYPDAELPEFRCGIDGSGLMRLHYSSPRGLADLAEGLVVGCGRHYGEQLTIDRRDLSGGAGCNVVFELRTSALQAA